MTTIDLSLFYKMFISGAQSIKNEFEYINKLNVFPVPDGDTGTNMSLTVSGALKDIASEKFESMFQLSHKFSRGLLMNARGNSGVILSQILKGFIIDIKEDQTFLSIADLIKSFQNAAKIAYISIKNPVEGTILTVISDISKKLLLNQSKYETVESLFDDVIDFGKVSLDNTPNLLPVLKDAGVVDSGGYGLLTFLKGFNSAITGKDNDEKLAEIDFDAYDSNGFHNEEGETDFGYCSEIIMEVGTKISPNSPDKKQFSITKFRKELSKIGDSLVCVEDYGLVKVHIHTFFPGTFLDISQKYGEFIKTKFENMTNQYYEKLKKDGIEILGNKKVIEKMDKQNVLNEDISIIMTAPSIKIKEILNEEYGIKYVIDTSINGNPSVSELLNLVQQTNSKNIILIIDDSNIFLAAQEAKELVRERINIEIIKGKNIAESLVAAIAFNSTRNIKSNIKNMIKEVKNCATATISKSIKDVTFGKVKIEENDFILVLDKDIIKAEKNEIDILKFSVDKLFLKIKKPDLIFFFTGENVDSDAIEEIREYISEKYNCFCDFKDGGQKTFNYYILVQ